MNNQAPLRSYEHFQTTTDDELILNGWYLSGDTSKPAALLIHGFTGDPYTHEFNHAIASALRAQGNATVLAQTRGTGLHTEFMTTDAKGRYVGSYYERIEEAHFDISAHIAFLVSQGYSDVVLIGHSLGTIKVVRYLFEGAHAERVSKVVLLAPFEKNAFLVDKLGDRRGEVIEHARQMIADGKGEEIVPVPDIENFEMSWTNFYSWYIDTDFNNIWDFHRPEYESPVLQKIDVPVLAVLGTNDEPIDYPQFGVTSESALVKIAQVVSNAETMLIEGADHVFNGYEPLLATRIATFVSAS